MPPGKPVLGAGEVEKQAEMVNYGRSPAQPVSCDAEELGNLMMVFAFGQTGEGGCRVLRREVLGSARPSPFRFGTAGYGLSRAVVIGTPHVTSGLSFELAIGVAGSQELRSARQEGAGKRERTALMSETSFA